eukprot:284818590_3
MNFHRWLLHYPEVNNRQGPLTLHNKSFQLPPIPVPSSPLASGTLFHSGASFHLYSFHTPRFHAPVLSLLFHSPCLGLQLFHMQGLTAYPLPAATSTLPGSPLKSGDPRQSFHELNIFLPTVPKADPALRRTPRPLQRSTSDLGKPVPIQLALPVLDYAEHSLLLAQCPKSRIQQSVASILPKCQNSFAACLLQLAASPYLSQFSLYLLHLSPTTPLVAGPSDIDIMWQRALCRTHWLWMTKTTHAQGQLVQSEPIWTGHEEIGVIAAGAPVLATEARGACIKLCRTDCLTNDSQVSCEIRCEP